jgi:hypothetical protein
MIKDFTYAVECNVCGWAAQGFSTAAKAAKAAKHHADEKPHADYEDVPLWDGPLGTGTGPVAQL